MKLRPKALLFSLLVLSSAGWTRPVEAALQFDVFPGYESTVHEAGWFPVTCEVFNDGPSFNAIIEISGSGYGNDQMRQVPIELPTNTRKRLVVPMFAAGHRLPYLEWEARLLTAEGKEIVKRERLQTKVVSWETIILGAVPRNFGGTPSFPDMRSSNRQNDTTRPEVARILVEQFPDNPIALEGLNAIYLNSEKAIELKVNQVTALLGWVRAGGHLIVSVEQPGDINTTPWLKQFLPVELTATVNQKIDADVISYVKAEPAPIEDDSNITINRPRARRFNAQQPSAYSSLPVDPAFFEADMPISTGSVKDGVALFASSQAPTAGTPLAVQAPRGRGKVTVLTFSPEREPFRSWKGKGYFWAKLCGIPGEFFNSEGGPGYGARSVDGVFGALIDSRQIKKLPVTWLLLLLVVYLVVIGPFDQWWLKKIGRQMLTWITFPAYVVLFSLLIYFIGYKLRAGETEWNELNIVDILPRGDKVDLRGRTYISIYSSGNAWYSIDGQPGYGTFRTELMDLYSGGHQPEKTKVVQDGNSFKAEVFVPVWTSMLFANEWFQTNDTPLLAAVSYTGSDYQVELENLMERPLTDVRVAVNQIIYDVGSLAPNEKKTMRLAAEKGTPLRTFVQQNAATFQSAVDLRRNPLGDTSGGHLENRPIVATAVSFLAYLDEYAQTGRNFVSPAGLDLASAVERGDAVVFAFVPDFSFTEKLNDFNPPRFKRDTVVRLTVPVRKSGAAAAL